MTPKHIFSFGMLLCGCLLCAQEIKNADFSGWSGKKPAFWTVDGSGLELKKNDNNGLEVKILSEGKLDSAIHQRVVGLPANKAYRFSAEIDAPAKCAYIQVKLYRDKRELKRMDSGLNRHAGKTLLKVDFNTVEVNLNYHYFSPSLSFEVKIQGINKKVTFLSCVNTAAKKKFDIAENVTKYNLKTYF